MDEAASEAERRDAPGLGSEDIASRAFGRVPNGLNEAEVRAFLRQLAELVSALGRRAADLEAQVRELEARAQDGSGVSSIEPDPRVDAAFARLRQTAAEPAPSQPEPSQPEPPTPEPASPTSGSIDDEPPTSGGDVLEPELRAPALDDVAPNHDSPQDDAPPEDSPQDDAPPDTEATGDDRRRAARDALLRPLVDDLLKAAKRLLQDEQNVLLDAARRARARVEPARLLPEPTHHRDAWAALLAPAVGTAYSGGRVAVATSRRPSAAPERVVNELAAGIIAPLRERLTATAVAVLAEGPYESPAELHRELAGAIGARYREWRGGELEVRLEDALTAAYARGAYDGAPSGSQLRWLKDAARRCPDCEDNSLEPTLKGQTFPTGQAYPPAHPGCRCLVIPVAD